MGGGPEFIVSSQRQRPLVYSQWTKTPSLKPLGGNPIFIASGRGGGHKYKMEVGPKVIVREKRPRQ